MNKKLETDRLILNSLSDQDLPFYKTLQTDPQVRQFLGGPVDESKIESKFDDYLKPAASNFHFAVRLKKLEFLGIISLERKHQDTVYEISYQFLPQFWGNGYAYESISSVFEFAKVDLGVINLFAETQFKNQTSKKLLEKLGMSFQASIFRFREKQAIYHLKFD